MKWMLQIVLGIGTGRKENDEKNNFMFVRPSPVNIGVMC